MTGDFRDECLQAINYTGTDNWTYDIHEENAQKLTLARTN